MLKFKTRILFINFMCNIKKNIETHKIHTNQNIHVSGYIQDVMHKIRSKILFRILSWVIV